MRQKSNLNNNETGDQNSRTDITTVETPAPAKGLPISEKYVLSIQEAGDYFGIGLKKMRRLAEEHLDDFAVMNGNRFLIIRTKFEEFLLNSSTI